MNAPYVTNNSVWTADQALIAGDASAAGTDFAVVRINVPLNQRNRKIYCAAIYVPSMSTGYQVNNSDVCNFVLRGMNGSAELFRHEFKSDNGLGNGFAQVGASGAVKNLSSLRPQFRWQMRDQNQPFGSAFDAPMVPDGVESVFRMTASGPMGVATEWLVQCAPWHYQGQLTEITIQPQNSGAVTPSQMMMFIGCLSADQYN